MLWVVILIVAALALGVLGLVIRGLLWLLIIAGILFAAGVVAGFVQRRRP